MAIRMDNEFEVKYFLQIKFENQSTNIQFSSELGNNCCQSYKLFINGVISDLEVFMFFSVHLCLMSRIQTYIDSSFLAWEHPFICRSAHLSFQNSSDATTAYLETFFPIEKDGFSQLTAWRLHTCVCAGSCVATRMCITCIHISNSKNGVEILSFYVCVQ